MPTAMTSRERFHALMNFQPVDRLPLVEWASWWDQTITRWHGEGLDPSLSDRYDLYRHFGLDMYRQVWVPSRKHNCPQPCSHGAGIIANMDDYRKIRPYLYPEVTPDWAEGLAEQQRGDAVLWFTVEGFFWFPRTLFGIEQHLYAFYDQPELMHQINSDLAQWMLQMIERMVPKCRPDFMTFAEDMSYNHGSMLSRELFYTFLKPYYEQVVPRLRDYGIIPVIDSDGDISEPAAWFEDAGLAGILPLERQADVDIAELRRRYPRLGFIGHFDKMTMPDGEEAMRAEFERLLPTARQGGFIISVDHQTPPGVSYQQYQQYIGLFQQYAQAAGSLG